MSITNLWPTEIPWLRRSRMRAWLDRHQPPEDAVLLSTALLTGVLTGFGAIGFIYLISGFRTFFGVTLPGWLGLTASPIWPVILPALGGLLAGPLIMHFSREAKGHGVPEVLKAVSLAGGRIHSAVVVVKALASSICIGTGGSAGREGPIVQIGAALGSNIGQLLHLSDARIRSLVACGAAAGIAATFNAPIAGAIFAQEVILGEFTTRYFGTVVISGVAASIVSRAILGDHPAFTVPVYRMESLWEILLFMSLGVLAALCAMLFVRVLDRFESLSEGWRFPEWAQPAVGGLLLGGLGFFLPQVMGTGLEFIGEILVSPLSILLMLVLVFAKIMATSFTLGFGNSGGVFSPSLYVGAMLGSVVGSLAGQWFPGLVAPPGAYALVGMAAVFAASTRASITAVLIVFEMSNDYKLILPLMASVVVATLVSEWLMEDTIYTIRLTKRGIRLERGRDIDVMQGVTVAEAMTTDVDTVLSTMTMAELAREFERSHHHGFPVVTPEGRLCGVVTLQDLSNAQERKLDGHTTTVGEICTSEILTAYPDEPVWSALRRLGVRDIGRLPVVDRTDSNLLVGLIRRTDIVKAYNKAMVRKQDEQHRERLRVRNVSGTQFVEVVVPADSWMAEKRVADLGLPQGCVLVSIHRGQEELIPRGDTVLAAGDRITALLPTADVGAFRQSVGRSAP